MANKTLTASVAGLTLALGLSLGLSAPADAAFQSCTGVGYDITGKVLPSTNCTILTPLNGGQNDVPQPGFVNTEGFFGISNWLFDGKWDSPPPQGGNWTDTSSLFAFTGGGQSGTFTLDGVLGTINEIMFVFKDGGDTSLVGYLIDIAALGADPYNGTGTYASPFTEPPFLFNGNGPRDVSHISVYYRTGTPSNGGGGGSGGVPEPGTLSLLGLAMLGGIFYSRRRKQMH